MNPIRRLAHSEITSHSGNYVCSRPMKHQVFFVSNSTVNDKKANLRKISTSLLLKVLNSRSASTPWHAHELKLLYSYKASAEDLYTYLN